MDGGVEVQLHYTLSRNYMQVNGQLHAKAD
jgi:hypothetical protein